MSTSSHQTAHRTPRQRAREVAFQFLFRYQLENEIALTEKEIDEEFLKHSSHFSAREDVIEFGLRLVKTTLKELKSVDAMIVKHASNWRIERIGAVDKTFLRMGVAELLYFKDVPSSVTINEIIELSKDFGEVDTPVFLNGILDPVSREPQAQAGKVPSNS